MSLIGALQGTLIDALIGTLKGYWSPWVIILSILEPRSQAGGGGGVARDQDELVIDARSPQPPGKHFKLPETLRV